MRSKAASHVEHYDHHFPICPNDYGELLKPVEALKSLADRFSTLSYQTDAHALAMPLKEELKELASDPQVLAAITESLAHYDSTTAEGFDKLHQLLERQATVSPVGAPQRMTSTGGAFSTSTNSAACASNVRPCSKRPTARSSS